MRNSPRTMKTISLPAIISAMTAVAILGSGCAFDLTHVKQSPANFQPVSAGGSRWKLNQEVKISIGTGYSTRLKAGTRWEQVGKIEQGDIFKTSDQILTVEASNIHEAYLVVRDGMVTGFYLSVERTFTPVSPPKSIQSERQ